MDDLNQKIIYGSLADREMAEHITREMVKFNIKCDFFTDEHQMNHLYVHNKEDLAQAVDYFRVLIGHKKPTEVAKEWIEIKKLPLGNLTFAVLIICILIYFFGFFMEYSEVYDVLMFGPSDSAKTFDYIKQNQLWRLVTPAFIHFGFLHILFNLLWWKDLANVLEYSKGKVFLLLFTLFVAIISNYFQALMSGPNFGGLSGVVYGLLSYLWVYKLFNPNSQFGLPKSDMVLMVLWLVFGIFDIFSFKMANWAHGMGMVAGAILAVIIGLYDRKTLSLEEQKKIT